MRHLKLLLLALLALTTTSLWRPMPAQAITIFYQATDLADAVPGEDLWQYSYTVTDFVFPMNWGFSIFFALGLYEDLEDPPPVVNADWDVLSIQPDPNLPDDGFYDALALVDNASLADTFLVSFTWLGGGTPGSQPFTVNEFDEQGVCLQCPFLTGETVPVGQTVPEPSTVVLVGTGLLGIGRLIRRQGSTRTSG